MAIQYPKGTKVICPDCDAHVATFAIDLKTGERLKEKHFDQSEGQGPWRVNDRFVCRRCGADLLLDWEIIKIIPRG